MNNRGRPKKEVCNSKVFNMRLSDEDDSMLNYLFFETGKTKTEIVRKAIKMYYNLEKSRH